MDNRKAIDPELQKSAQSFPFNRAVVAMGNLYLGASWRRIKAPEGVREEELEIRGCRGLPFQTPFSLLQAREKPGRRFSMCTAGRLFIKRRPIRSGLRSFMRSRRNAGCFSRIIIWRRNIGILRPMRTSCPFADI